MRVGDNMTENRTMPSKHEYVKVRIPEKYRKQADLAGLPTMEVYLWATWCAGIWVKVDLAETRVYPLCINLNVVKRWEVINE